MNKNIFASFYSRQEAENAINNLKTDVLSDDNPVIIRDNNQYNANLQTNDQTNTQNSSQTAQNTLNSSQTTQNAQNPEGNYQFMNQTQQIQPPTQGNEWGTTNCLPLQMPYYNPNNFTGYAQQSLNNGYNSGSTIGGLFGLATSAISMATIGAPYILTTTLANMLSYPMNQNQPAWANTSVSPTINYYSGCPPTSDQTTQSQQNNGVQVSLNVPEEKLMDVANSLKNSNAVDVRSS